MPNSASYCQEIAKSRPELWRKLRETLVKLENDQSYLLRIEFRPDRFSESSILHNLPLPDFDDTGFVGRGEEVSIITKAIRGAYPVVTITGEGGLGKTAVALKVCYDLLDSDDCNFDAIIWVTAKTTKLTGREIQNIDNAIISSLGLFETAASQIDDAAEGDPLERLISQLEAFKILLIIDNLETVLDENIRSLVQQVPTGSKILFTTKKSIGAYDFPIPLKAFTDKEAEFYLRAIARFWGQEEIARAPSDQVKSYIARLQRNPLFIKWFVQAVSEGQSPQKVLADPKIVLKFCLSFVFENLSTPSKKVLQTLAFDSRGATESLIIYFTDLEPSDVQTALTELMASNLVRMTAGVSEAGDAVFTPSEMALFYIRNYHDGKEIDETAIIKKKRTLTAAREQFASIHKIDPYDYNNISVRGDGDLIAAKLLKDSMLALRNSQPEISKENARKAEGISPTYFEVHRVLALIYQHEGMLMRANERFQSAISLERKSAALRFWYGDFLFKCMDDHDAAYEQYEEGLKSDPNSIPLMASIGRLKLAEKDFESAIEWLTKAEGIDTRNTKHKRRLLDLIFQYYARSIYNFVSSGEMRTALHRLIQLQGKINSVDTSLIDKVMVQKVLKVNSAVSQIRTFFEEGDDAEQSARVTAWFAAYFGSSALLGSPSGWRDDVASEKIFDGTLKSLHDGYGFIDGEKGTLFFPFSEWVDAGSPLELHLGVGLKFKVGENNRGPIGVKVYSSDRMSSAGSWALGVQGVISSDHATYCFIAGEDGKTYFLSYSDFLSTVPSEKKVGMMLEFDVSPERKGKYPAAKFAKVV
ncbi:NB-ARC domain-containing protein [Marinovum sp.]|uniref:NB-ARC domain-containing protein n=1 Tax=Marinovum sp. TaxID=2024839 RepID=UPI003A8E3A98